MPSMNHFKTIFPPMQLFWLKDSLLKRTPNKIGVYWLNATWLKINTTKFSISLETVTVNPIDISLLSVPSRFLNLKKLKKHFLGENLGKLIKIMTSFPMEAMDFTY